MRNRGSREAAAAELGVSTKTIYNRLNKIPDRAESPQPPKLGKIPKPSVPAADGSSPRKLNLPRSEGQGILFADDLSGALLSDLVVLDGGPEDWASATGQDLDTYG